MYKNGVLFYHDEERTVLVIPKAGYVLRVETDPFIENVDPNRGGRVQMITPKRFLNLTDNCLTR